MSAELAVDGVTVSPMAKPGGLEVILGIITDPQYGPTLMFGLGGIYTEIYKDVAFCILPATTRNWKISSRASRAILCSPAFGANPSGTPRPSWPP